MGIQLPSSKCYLVPIDLHNESQFNEIRRQRIICGWDSVLQTLQDWKGKENIKRLFWITIPQPSAGNETIRAGHISLDASSGLLEPDIAPENRTELSISSFFILPEYRSLGLGKRAVKLVENVATTERFGNPRCRFITLTALSKRYVYDEAPEWRGVWAKLGLSPPSFSIQKWYEGLGYVAWKEEPITEEKGIDGQVILLWEAFMRKDLQSNIDIEAS
jgi:GNAT superfamily N-acetyltransferase